MLEAAEGEGPAARTEPGLRARGGPPFDTCADRGAVAWRNHRRATSPRPPRPGVGPRADRTAWCRTGAGAGAPSPCAGRVGLHIAEPSPARPVIQRNRLATGEWVEMEVEAQAVVSRAMPYISANAPSAARARSSFVHVSRALASSSGQVGVAVGQPEVAQVDEPRHLQGLRVEDDVGQAKAPAADDGVGGLLVPSPRDLRGEAGQQLRRSRVLLLKGEGPPGSPPRGSRRRAPRRPSRPVSAERALPHGYVVQPAARVRDAFPEDSQVRGGHLVSGYAGDGTGHQAGTRVTGVPVEDPGSRYALVAQPRDPVALGLQAGRVRT